MSRKRIVLIDGSSMVKGAFFSLPGKGAHGIRNLIVRVIESGEAEYLAAAFHSINEEGQVQAQLIRQQDLLKEIFGEMGIPFYGLDGYSSADLITTLTKQCKEEDGDVVILSENRALLQVVGDGVTVRIPVVREGGLEFMSYSAEDIRQEYGLEPVELKGVFSLTGITGIGEKTACHLIQQYQSVENLYKHIHEFQSQRVRDILLDRRTEVEQAEEFACLHEDCNICMDYTKPLLKEDFITISHEEGVPFDSHESELESIMETSFHAISDFTEAEAVFAKCGKDSRLGLQLVVEEKALRAMALCMGETECYCIIPQGFLTSEYLAGKAGEICKKAEQVTVLHLKSQLPYLNLDTESRVFDAGVAAYLLNPMKDSYEYQDLAEDYLEVTLPSRTELLGKYSVQRALEESREKVVSWAGYMAYVAWKSGDILRAELKKSQMDQLFYEIEMPLIYSLYNMEKAGIRVERQRLKEYGDRLKVRIEELEKKIHEETGETFNINSPKQLGEVLFDHMKLPGGKKTKTGYSTAADVLEKLATDNPVVGLILDYRQLTKLNSTYADGLAAYIGSDERIHGTFNQTITATGRISSTEPNLQNIPVRMELGREIRKVFVPQEGCVFVDADYSQIELRVLAHMSGDQRLINAYMQAEDIHAITASEVFHVPLDEVTSLQRRNAKAVNFGIVYGISSFGLSEGLSITRKEATEYIEKYFETYPGVKLFLDRLVADAKEQGYAVSMFGRRRPVPELKSSNFMQRSFGERVAMNSPIQGTAADIMKIAMVRVDKALKVRGLKSRIVLQVHDELLIEAFQEELDQVKELLVEEMRHAADLEVSLEVEANTGGSWFDAK